MSQGGVNRSPSRRGRSLSRGQGTSPPPRTHQGNNLYFCHYRNAMYMGGIRSFKKQGRGILLHDNGVSLVGNYLNDALNGHNIFFAQHCLLSADFVKGRMTNAVYRTHGFLLQVELNSEGQLQGKSHLLNYSSKTLWRLQFRGGAMVLKEEEKDVPLLNKLFDLGQVECIVGKTHARVLRYEIERSQNIEGQKYGNKLTVGFEKGGLVNGLGLTVVFRGSHGGYNPDTHRMEDDFELRVLERGYMSNSQLQGMGEKWFKNGNCYMGEFKNGVFEGNGVLLNASKGHWVSGYFERGDMVDLSEHHTEIEGNRYRAILESLHERKNNWINNEAIIPSLKQFDQHIELILASQTTMPARSLEQRKQAVLKRIQDNFLADTDSLALFLEEAKTQNFTPPPHCESQAVKRFVYSFTPDILDHHDPPGGVPKDSPSPLEPSPHSNNMTLSLTPNRMHLRRSKIFERSVSTDRYKESRLSARKSSRTPEKKKRIFVGNGTHRTHYRPEERGKQAENPQNLLTSLVQDESSYQNGGVSDSFLVPLTPKNRNIAESAKKESSGKSKIFNYLREQRQEASPRFVYKKVDTLKEAQKRKRLGTDDDS